MQKTFGRNNMKFNLQKQEQKEAHDFLTKLDRGQAKFVSRLIVNYFKCIGIENSEELTEKEAKAILQQLLKEEVITKRPTAPEDAEMNVKRKWSVADHLKDVPEESNVTRSGKNVSEDFPEFSAIQNHADINNEEDDEDDEENLNCSLNRNLLMQLGAFM